MPKNQNYQKHKRIKSSSNKKWFNRECRFKRHELRKLSNQKHRDPLNSTLRKEYHAVLTQYKTLLYSKKNEYYNAKILELEDSAEHTDTTKFWKCLKSMDDTIKVKDDPLVSEENWLLHFQSLHSNEPLNPAQQLICNELREHEDRKKQYCPLHYLITETEIRTAAKKLKNNKTPFSNKIRNEMIEASLHDMMPVYYKLFNTILNSGIMPQT